jgi:hypothetical protein
MINAVVTFNEIFIILPLLGYHGKDMDMKCSKIYKRTARYHDFFMSKGRDYVSELRPPTGLLFFPYMIYECGALVE